MSVKSNDVRRTASFAEAAFQNYAAELHRFLMRRVHRTEDAEDLAQEVFMRLWRIDNNELVCNPRAYLFGVAAHVVFEFRMRRLSKEWITYNSETVEQLEERPTEFSQDSLADRLDTERQLRAALAQLPPLQLAVFLLHKRDGYSYEEIERMTNLSARKIESHIAQARVLLRKMHWDR